MSGPVAFLGLGAMGRPMALNLARGGYLVHGFDVVPAAVARFARDALGLPSDSGGAVAFDSHAGPAAAADDAGALVLMVVNARQAETVLFEQGALAALRPGALVVLMATCAPPAVEAIAARVAASGRHLVDAPVSGGVVGAEAASLTIMAAADDDTFARAEPMLRAMGSRLFRVGSRPGQGAMVKTINQLLCGVHIAAGAEALALAAKAGLDGAQLIEIFAGSAAASWMLADRGPRMMEQDPVVKSAVDIFVKDLGIVLEAGEAAKAATPMAALARQLFLAASAQGRGMADDSQVVRVLENLAGR